MFIWQHGYFFSCFTTPWVKVKYGGHQHILGMSSTHGYEENSRWMEDIKDLSQYVCTCTQKHHTCLQRRE